MNLTEQITAYINSVPDQKRAELQQLHELMLKISLNGKLWFYDGKNEENKVIANPTFGYGVQVMKYANGKTRDWFRVGISENKTGISVYILGIADKTYLSKTLVPL